MLESIELVLRQLKRKLSNVIGRAIVTPQKKNMYDLDAANMNMNYCSTILCVATLWDLESFGTKKGEKNSKYFLDLENARSGQTTIRRLFDSKGWKLTVNPN